jgi:hypothetical protein
MVQTVDRTFIVMATGAETYKSFKRRVRTSESCVQQRRHATVLQAFRVSSTMQVERELLDRVERVGGQWQLNQAFGELLPGDILTQSQPWLFDALQGCSLLQDSLIPRPGLFRSPGGETLERLRESLYRNFEPPLDGALRLRAHIRFYGRRRQGQARTPMHRFIFMNVRVRICRSSNFLRSRSPTPCHRSAPSATR